MNVSQSRVLPMWPLLATLTVLCSICGAGGLDDLVIIDRTTLPGAWYRIILDEHGDYVMGEGDGEGWYYYPATGLWRHWFYNQPYNPDRSGHVEYRMFITANDYSKAVTVEIYGSWTKPAWSLLGHNRPPLPEDMPTADAEAQYIESTELMSLFDVGIGSPQQAGSVEPNKDFSIYSYNPDWFSIDVRGKNLHVFRGVLRECLPRENNSDQTPPPTVQVDFGDAPATYGTTLAGNGARHTIVSGVQLGRTIDGESDGLPTPTAMGDDNHADDDEDGVVFTSELTPGGTATVEVTASTQGYLNAWMDCNRNGVFDGRDEQIFSDTRLVAGVNRLDFTIPANVSAGDCYARFRFNTRGLLPQYGPAQDGEVEDYKVSIGSAEVSYLPSPGRGGLKWSQPPQNVDTATPFFFNGWDELSGLHLHQILADDWQCTDDLPITGFQWWGSFERWTKAFPPAKQPLAFHIGIWTDAPGTNSNYPGSLIWEAYCTDWTWSVAGYDDDIRGITQDETCFQFTALLSQDQWFYQTPSVGTDGKPVPVVYWLSIAAVYDIQTSAPENPWGWTTRPHSFNDAAVRIAQVSAGNPQTGSWPPSLGSQWLAGEPVEYPARTKWDLAFELLTNQGSQAPTPTMSTSPVYRFWSDQLTTHFYTISDADKDFLIKEYPNVWKYEGIAFYAYLPDQPPVSGKPVYRLWSGNQGRHFYTTSESEKDRMLQDPSNGWAFEGIAWYAL